VLRVYYDLSMKIKAYKIVHNHIEKIMPRLERLPTGRIPFSFLLITYGHFYPEQIYCWDYYHMAIRFAYAGKPDYLKYLIDTLLYYQSPDGFTPNCITEKSGPMHYFPKFHAQPFLMQGALVYLFQTGNLRWVKEQFDKLKKYLEYYWYNNLTHLGLFRWSVSWMSGIDNDVTTSFSLPETIITADINAWLYLECRSATILASRLGKKNDEKIFKEKAKTLHQLVNDILWYEEMSSYSAYNLLTGTHHFHLGKGTESERVGYYAFQSCSNLIPLYAQMADRKRAIDMIKKYLLHEKHFWSPYGIRSLSKSSPYYNNAIFGNPPRFGEHHRMTNSNWQGPVWTLLNYFMFHALIHYGFKKEAEELVDKTMFLLASSLEKIGSFTENYDAETGQPLFAPGYGSWNILMDMMYQELRSGKWIMDPIFEEI